MERTLTGLLVGMILGAALAFGSFGQMLTVAFFGAIAVIVLKVIEGEIDLGEILSSPSRRRR